MAVNVLEKLAKSKSAQSGKYIEAPARYTLGVEKLAFLPDAFNGPTFVAEFRVLEVEKTGEQGLKLNKATGELERVALEPHPVGDNRSFVVVLKDNNDSTYQNVKAFLAALTGLADDQIDMAGIEALCGKEQPARGWKVIDDVFVKPQKKDRSKAFTNHRWAHVPRA